MTEATATTASPTTNGQPSAEYLAAIAYTTAKASAKKTGLGELWAETEKTLIAIVSSRGMDKSYGEMYARRILPRIIPQDRTSATWTDEDTRNLRSALSTLSSHLEERINALTEISYKALAHNSPCHYSLPQPATLGFEGAYINKRGKIVGKILAKSTMTALGMVRSSVGSLSTLERHLLRNMVSRGWRLTPPRMVLDAIEEMEQQCHDAGLEVTEVVDEALSGVTYGPL